MDLSEFDYDLPKELIAQEGLPEREKARLMVLRQNGKIEHSSVQNLCDFFHEGDLLVLNNTRVLPSKLLGRKQTGGKIDCLLLNATDSKEMDGCSKKRVRDVLLRGSNVKVGVEILFYSARDNSEQALKGTVVEKMAGSKFKIEFNEPSLVDSYAGIPLPPYIKQKLSDPDRYQTVYSEKLGALAAPTAGLHFTSPMLKRLSDQGVEIVFLTLHIGIGTFAPIRSEKVEDWQMEPEVYDVPVASAKKINESLKNKKKVFAVGTTTVRTLESSMFNGEVRAGRSQTELFIYPGIQLKFPYAGLLTNFHLPKSSLILLAGAFAGKERLFLAYKQAVEKKYRFYSFGDAMLILK